MHAKPPLPPEVWKRMPVEAQAYIRALDVRVVVLEATVQRLQATIQQLTERLQHDSRTSSRPPSSDPPQATGKRQRREPSGRRPGGQPGHEGQARAMLPVEAVDVVIPVKPVRCPRCQHPLCEDDPQPYRHQVTEIPPVKPVVMEYQLHRLVCPVCGEATRAAVPAGVPSGGFGPWVQAITALCTGAYHLSKRATQSVLEDLCGVTMILGTLANLEQATVHGLAEAVAEARAYVPQQPVAYLDEPGWREGSPRAWLWTAVTTGVTVFGVRRWRRGQVAQELVGECFWGWLVTDRWSGYSWYLPWRRQRCWAHLLRDIEAMIVRGGPSQALGEALQAQARQMFHWWPRVRDGTLAQASFAPEFRLMIAAVVGPRTLDTAKEVVAVTKARVAGIPAFFSDGFTGYLAALIAAFHVVTTLVRTGKRECPRKPVCEPHPDLAYGQLVKQKKQGKRLTLSTRVLLGAERLTQLGLTISTALVERVNLTLRQALAPLARQTYSFCKDRERMRQRVVFFQAFYNVARPHMSLRRPLPMRERKRQDAIRPRWRERTPAMAAGSTDHVWTFRELLTAKFEPLNSQSISG
jgi:transposase